MNYLDPLILEDGFSSQSEYDKYIENWAEENSETYVAIIDFPGDVFDLEYDCENAFEQQDLTWSDYINSIDENTWNELGPSFNYDYYPSSVNVIENKNTIWFGKIKPSDIDRLSTFTLRF